jgi:uncharacterized membrane protein SpoIIM required for sporulation
MFEMIMKPKRAERRPYEMFFIGLVYATISMLFVNFIFAKDTALREGSGLLLVLFTVLSCLPFVYFLIKLEEGKDVEISDSGRLIKEHSKAIFALIWLFVGIVVAFSIGYVLMDVAGQNPAESFNFQIKTYCAINSPQNYENCLGQYGLISGSATTSSNFFYRIFMNNLGVMLFTLVFSLIFGAGAIFILVWNASVIAAAIGIFAKQGLFHLPCAYVKYLVHGVPEIAAYFIAALAGGIVSVAIIRKDMRGERLWSILQDALLLVIVAIAILFVSGLMEVYLTPGITSFVGCGR